ncbi:hypothetical protein XENOCAPTIV_006241 [Xenoophorus captivus]|uniref:Uncharacterized protein n=1 Tax=Xenoophorus captivus TaxID=1517983 RepID=A0ABV0S1K3_9TELE
MLIFSQPQVESRPPPLEPLFYQATLSSFSAFSFSHFLITLNSFPFPAERRASSQHDAASAMFHSRDDLFRVMCYVSCPTHLGHLVSFDQITFFHIVAASTAWLVVN